MQIFRGTEDLLGCSASRSWVAKRRRGALTAAMLEFGGEADHFHMLVVLPPTEAGPILPMRPWPPPARPGPLVPEPLRLQLSGDPAPGIRLAVRLDEDQCLHFFVSVRLFRM